MNGQPIRQLAFILLAGVCGASCGHTRAKTEAAPGPPLPCMQGDLLPGHWRLRKNDFASIIINKDSVFYTDQNRGGAYRCTGQALVLSYGPHCDTVGYRVRDSDTLAIYNYGDSQVYVRMEQ